MTTAAIDPGPGLGVAWRDKRNKIHSMQFQIEQDGHERLWAILGELHEAQKLERLILERFLFLHEFKDRAKIDLTAAEYVGVVKLWCAMNKVELVLQNGSQACGASAFWGDSENTGNPKIKALGLWVQHRPHQMDALRHLLYWISFTNKEGYILERLRQAR